MNNNIALIYGGEGHEREISKLSAKNLFSMIDKQRYKVFPIFISEEGYWEFREDFSEERAAPTYPARIFGKSGFILNGKILEVKAAIPALHGDFGEDGKIQGALATAHIPYLGCDTLCGAVASDKIYTKIIAEHLSVPCAKWIFADDGTKPAQAREKAEKSFGYPMFIKPTSLGSSIGAHKVSSEEEFEDAFRDAYQKGDGRILIEEYVDSVCEIECAFLGAEKKHIAPYGRICTGGAVYDYSGKYMGVDSPKILHGKDVNRDYSDKIREYSEKLISFLKIRHLSRIDFFLTKDGRIYFNEINTFPGMTASSLYPQMTEDMGYPRGEFINTLIEEASL